MSLGVAFSGGGVKGIAHLGALKCFEENNIKIDYISGCSSGSIVALLYALGFSAEEMYNLCLKYFTYVTKNVFNINLFNLSGIKKTKGLNNGIIIENILNKICHEKNIFNILDISIPIFIPAVDLNTGKLIYFTNQKKRISNETIYISEGNIYEIVRASCSYPGVFSPKKIENYLLVDGGLRDNVPVKPLLDYNVNEILAITFNSSKENQIDNIFDVIFQSFEILVHDNTYESVKHAKYLLELDLGNTKIFDISKLEEIYMQGYNQTKRFLK